MRKVALVAILLAGCATAPPRPPPPPPPAGNPAPAEPPAPEPAPAPRPPPPPPPARSLISEAEAVRIAARFARSRGLSVQRYKARLDSKERWVVDLKAQRGVDRAKVLIDARDGRVLRAKLRREDPDWDD